MGINAVVHGLCGKPSGQCDCVTLSTGVTMHRQDVCSVCDNEEAIGIAAVPGVPMSVTYGINCLRADAHPYKIVVMNTAMIGGYAKAAPWWQELTDRTLAYLKVSREQFDKDVAAAFEEDVPTAPPATEDWL